MKFMFALLGSVLFLGTLLSLHLAQEAWFFLPLYVLATYHLYRVNYSEGFFVVFNKRDEKEALAKVRLGPTEIGPKDEGDRKEEKFIALFDWRRKTIRNVLSWLVFGGTIYLYFFRLKMEINLASVLTLVTSLFVMRSISVGHLLVPLTINLFMVLIAFPDFIPLEKGLMLLYGIMFVLLLSLVYPSEEKLGKKLKDWKSGKWMDVLRTALVLLLTLGAGLYLLPEKFQKRPPVTKETVEIKQKELRNLESSIRGMERMGLMKRPDLQEKGRVLAHDLQKFTRESEREEVEWNELQKRLENLKKEVVEARQNSPSPRLTPELIEKMSSDLQNRARTEADPLMLEKIESLMKRMENYNGTGGSDIVGDYREMKFGDKGYYREETDFQEASSLSSQSANSLEEMKKASEKKKEISDRLEKNIEELKTSPDEGLLSVNKALKDELEAVDSLSSNEKSLMQNELSKTRRSLEELAKRSKDPALQDKIHDLVRKNQQHTNEITPHMKAETKSEMAEKIFQEKKELEKVTSEVRQEIEKELKKQDPAPEDKPEEKKDYSGLIRLAVLALGGMLFFWFMSRFKKKGIKKVRGISEELKEEIEQKLREVKKKRLAPREEVIETYNVLHDGLSGLVFTGETPPSCIVYEGMAAAEPELTKPLFTVTETFATTFYGDHEVTTPVLKNFRKDVTKVFSFFDIRT